MCESTEKINAITGRKTPEFHGNTVIVERSGATVANMMLWDKAVDFVAFRDANCSASGVAIGHYGPKPQFYEVASAFKTP